MKPNTLINIDIIIPIKNEEKYIYNCIISIIKQSYDISHLNIYAVDGYSEDNTLKILKKFENMPFFHIVMNPHGYTSHALNKGLDKSQSDIVIILGAHSVLDKDYIDLTVKTLKIIQADCVGGTIQTIGETFMEKSISFAMSSPFGVGNALFRYAKKPGYVDTVAFGAYKREVFEQIGKFDEELIRNQDDEFNYRLRKAGGGIYLNPEIKAYYYSRATLRKLWKQYFQYGFYKVRVLQKHPSMMQWRHFVPVTFVMVVIISLAIAFYIKESLWLFSTVTLCYLSTAFFFAGKIASQKGWKHFFMLPVAFLFLHTAYGIGFFVGFFRFIHRWFNHE
jgi:cellulose synthase/poly-beta-1,6-N-acetylglucosamine synthase-like glycosyltransferase